MTLSPEATAPTASSPRAVHVIATTFDSTGDALAVAIPLAHGSSAPLTVIVAQVIPEDAALELPSPEMAAIASRYRGRVHELGGEADIDVPLCRSIGDVLARVPANATIVVGGPVGRSLATPEERLAGQLSQMGRRVVFVPSVS